MDLNYIKKLIKLVSDSGVDELEVEEEGKKIRIAKRSVAAGGGQPVSFVPQVPASLDVTVPAPVPSRAPAANPGPAPAVAQETKYHEVKSPIVGTFYRAPAPDASPFVQIGSEVSPGSVLCIVEAMKLMNEIESDVSGKIAKILVENGQPVEYDQALFLVEPA
jgi:acetyl-CoA carboxylase biotin carboxyl carrier protein